MPELREGQVTVVVPDELTPPDKAGKMSPDEVRSIPKPPRGVGAACEMCATCVETAGARFQAPADVTPAGLRTAGRRAEGIDGVLLSLAVVQEKLRQANLLFDADAWEQLRKVNDMVKAQAKHQPELVTLFTPVLDFFAARAGRGAGPGTDPTA